MAKTKAQPHNGVIEIPYEPREWAQAFHDNPKRWKVLVLHRRAGKTTACLNHLVRDAMITPRSRYAYIGPTYKQSKNVAWDMLKQISNHIPGTQFHEVELRVTYPNGSVIQLYGADNPDSLRGIGLWGVVFDEYSQQPSNIFTEIIGPALADNQGYAIWIGTPQGKNEFYRLYNKASTGVDEEGQDISEDWYGLLLKASESNILPEKELLAMRKIMSADEFNQEFECSFDASIKGAYYADCIQAMRNEGRIKHVAYDPSLSVFTVWDIGIGDATAIGFYQKFAEELRMIDFYENTDKGLNHYVQVCKDKNYVYSQHFAPHDIQVREFSSGKSRLEIARELGIYFQIVPKLAVDDGINAGRAVFPRMYIDAFRCQLFIDYISQYHKVWDEKRGMFRDTPLHDFTSHAADVHRYMAVIERNAATTATEEEFALYTNDYK
jgi:phage terminase large subunit